MGSYWDASGKLVDGRYEIASRKASVIGANYDQPLTVAAGATGTITITPPVGELWRIHLFQIAINPPAGTTTGTHQVEVMTTSNAWQRRVILAKSLFSSNIEISCNSYLTSDSQKLPTTDDALGRAITNLVVTNSSPLYINYTNNTNVQYSATALLSLVREVESIV